MGGNDNENSGHRDTYVGNNYLPNGLNVPSSSTPAPPNPPHPPFNANIDTYVGNNYGFGGNKFDGTYEINIGGGGQKEKPKVKPDSDDKTKPKPKPDTNPCKPDVQLQPCHTSGRSTYTLPGGGMQTSCPVCEGIWARNNSMSNYQALLRGDHIYN